MLTKVDFEKISGLTIRGAVRSTDDVLLTFTDGTYLLMHASPGRYDEGPEIEFQAYEVGNSTVDYDHLVTVGLFASMQELDSERRAKSQRSQDQWERQQRAQYEQLKAKFEGKS